MACLYGIGRRLYTQAPTRRVDLARTYNASRRQTGDADVSRPYPHASGKINVHTRYICAKVGETPAAARQNCQHSSLRDVSHNMLCGANWGCDDVGRGLSHPEPCASGPTSRRRRRLRLRFRILRADLATLGAKELEAARILAARESYKPHQRELNR